MDYEEVKEKALTLLEYRSHSEKELRDKLRRKGADDEDIHRVMDFLREYGFVNDEVYADRLAHDLVRVKKYGAYRVKRELMSRGIAEDIAAAAAENNAADEEETLLPLVEKKLAGNFDKKNIDKAIRYFIYRGYRFDDIRRCIDTAKQNGEEYGV